MNVTLKLYNDQNIQITPILISENLCLHRTIIGKEEGYGFTVSHIQSGCKFMDLSDNLEKAKIQFQKFCGLIPANASETEIRNNAELMDKIKVLIKEINLERINDNLDDFLDDECG